MAGNVSDVLSETSVRMAAEALAEKYGKAGYEQLCKQWGRKLDDEEARIFIAAFTIGAHAAISVIQKGL